MLQLAMVIVVLAWTIFSARNSRIQIMKGNSLPTMYALSEDSKRDLGGMGDVERLERRVSGVRVNVVLRRREEGEVRGLDVA